MPYETGAQTPKYSRHTQPPAPVRPPDAVHPWPAAVARMMETPRDWVKIKGTHVNMDFVSTFYWSEIKGLVLYYVGSDKPSVWHDPDKQLYKKLCEALGIEVDTDETGG